MKSGANYFMKIIKLLILASIVLSCEKTNVNIDNISENSVNEPKGTIEIEFQLPNSDLPHGCIIRVNLVIAIDAGSLYKEEYLKSFNVSDSQLKYTIKLPPGSYHYQAGVMCICETNSCSGEGYSGGQFGLKYTADMFYITKDETTFIVPSFN